MSNEREVTIRIKVIADKSGAREQSQALTDIEKAAKEAERAQVKAAKEAEKAAKEAAKQQSQLAREAAKAAREVERAVRQQQSVMDAAVRQQQVASQKLFGSMMQAREGSMMALGGVTQLGRGLAILGVSGEKDVQKVLQSLLKIQAAFDILRGGGALIAGMAKSWAAYRAAVEASAAAHVALAAAQAASSKGAVGSGVSQAAPALIPAGGQLVGGGIGSAAVAIAPLVAVGAAIAAIIAGVGALIDDEFRKGILNLVGLLDEAGEATKAFTEKTRRRELQSSEVARIATDQARMAAARFEAGLIGGEQYAYEATEQREIAFSTEEEGRPGGSLSVRLATLKAEQDAIRAVQQAEQQRLTASRQRIQESLSAARQELSIGKSLLDAEKQRSAALQERYTSAKERFGGMAPEEQQALLRIGQKASSGGSLSREEAAALRGLGLESTAAQARAADVARAEAAGFERTFGAQDRAAIEATQRRVAQLTLDVKSKHEISIKLDADTRAVEQKIADIVNKYKDVLFHNLIKTIETEGGKARMLNAQQLTAAAG